MYMTPISLYPGLGPSMFRVEQAARLVRVKAILFFRTRGLQDEVVDVLVLLRHKDRVAVGLSLAIVTVPLCRFLRSCHNGVCASLVAKAYRAQLGHGHVGIHVNRRSCRRLGSEAVMQDGSAHNN